MHAPVAERPARGGRRLAFGAGTVALVLGLTMVAATGVASAHQPVFVTEGVGADQTPLLEDGRVSFAIYGTLGEPGAAASFRVRHGDGERFNVEVLVPDRPPENARSTFDDLTVVVTDPSGQSTELRGAGVLARFDEPFSKTSYLRVITSDGPAMPGVSTVTVRSQVPTRFTVATGSEERFDGKVSSYTPPPGAALQTWYETPPPPAPPTSAPAPAPAGSPSTSSSTTASTGTTAAPTGAVPGSPGATSPPPPGASPEPETATAAPAASTPRTGLVVAAVVVLVIVLAAGAAVVARRRT